jgi:hypothetical protein
MKGGENMELKVQVNTIIIKDQEIGQQQTIKTVRTVGEIVADIEHTEREAMDGVVDKLMEDY